MHFLSKIVLVVAILGLIYLWNRFVIKNMIRLLIGFHKRYNAARLERQPLRFVVKNEDAIYKIYAGFFWVAGAVISIGILLDN